jgi:hypothetical protein
VKIGTVLIVITAMDIETVMNQVDMTIDVEVVRHTVDIHIKNGIIDMVVINEAPVLKPLENPKSLPHDRLIMLWTQRLLQVCVPIPRSGLINL